MDYNLFTVKVLKEKLKKSGLSYKGNKNDLVKRLMDNESNDKKLQHSKGKVLIFDENDSPLFEENLFLKNNEKMEQPVKERGVIYDIKKFVVDHPQIIYKGVPFLFVLYLSYPIVESLWNWFPWIWASYDIYHKIPKGVTSGTYKIIKYYLS